MCQQSSILVPAVHNKMNAAHENWFPWYSKQKKNIISTNYIFPGYMTNGADNSVLDRGDFFVMNTQSRRKLFANVSSADE